MTARRPPSTPPAIPGFDYVELLGSGGFADVFLYEQRMPRRRVAIKVLLSESLTPGARESFDAEANLMAQLSTHPSIVTIYQADIADDGRPYLAMEYCPRPNLGARYRRERISVAEVLRIGVQVAGAVETSHRAGILHRDIKPANILVTEYNRPALTDFGISVALVGGDEQESVGMSIPWSPPEVFAATPSSGVAADIYSLGATLYTLLAGRSPFEVPGGANSGLDLIARIQTARLAPTGRADVPASLEQVLATAMARSESSRYSTALEFARALQKVQLELSLSVTPADVLDEQLPDDAVDEEDEGNTRVRGIVTIDPTAPVTNPGRRADARQDDRLAATEAPIERTALRDAPSLPVEGPRRASAPLPAPAEPALEETLRREPASSAPDDAVADPRTARRPLPFIIAAVVIVLLVGIGALVFALNTGQSPAQQSADESAAATSDPVDEIDLGGVVAAPLGLTGTVAADGSSVDFSWQNPDEQEGDTYLWAVSTPTGAGQAARVEQPSVSVPTEGGASVCIEVSVVRSDGRASDPTRGCAP